MPESAGPSDMGKIAGIPLLLLAIGLGFGQDLTHQAESAFRSGDFDRAVALARKAQAEDPSSTQAYLILGIVAARRNQWDAATRSFKALIQLVPSDPQAYFYLGQACLYQQKWDQAVTYFSLARDHNYRTLTGWASNLPWPRNKLDIPRRRSKP